MFNLFKKAKAAPRDPVEIIAGNIYACAAPYPPEIDSGAFPNEAQSPEELQRQHRYRWSLLSAVFGLSVFKQFFSQQVIDAGIQAYLAQWQSGGGWLPPDGEAGFRRDIASVESQFGPILLNPEQAQDSPTDMKAALSQFVFDDGSEAAAKSLASGIAMVFGVSKTQIEKESREAAEGLAQNPVQ